MQIRGPNLYYGAQEVKTSWPADILPRQVEKILLASANMKYGLGGQPSIAVKKCTHYNSPRCRHKYREVYGGVQKDSTRQTCMGRPIVSVPVCPLYTGQTCMGRPIMSVPVCPLGVHCQVLVGLAVIDKHTLIGLHIQRGYGMWDILDTVLKCIPKPAHTYNNATQVMQLSIKGQVSPTLYF